MKGHFRNWTQTLAMALTLASLCSAVVWASPPAPTYEPDGSVPPAIVTLRRHMLDPEVNSLTFHNMDQLFETRGVTRAGPVWNLPSATTPLPNYKAADKEITPAEFFNRTYTNAFLVIKNGKIVSETYLNHTNADTHFVGFSMSKSVTSMLVGVAVDKGLIKSVDDKVIKYLPELKGSGYDGPTIRQILQMHSGAEYSERIEVNPPSQSFMVFENAVVQNKERFSYVAKDLKKKHPPGSTFNYNTVETSVLGLILERVTGKSIAALTTEYLWQPAGMEADAFWMADGKPGVGTEMVGLGFNATMRDFGRIGQLMLQMGKVGDRQIIPASWVTDSSTMKPTGHPIGTLGGPGYGYQWWQLDNSPAFAAVGLGGQFIFVDPVSKTVIVKMSYFPLPKTFEQQDVVAYMQQLLKWQPK